MSWRWSFLHTYVKYLVLLARFIVILLAYMCSLATTIPKYISPSHLDRESPNTSAWNI